MFQPVVFSNALQQAIIRTISCKLGCEGPGETTEIRAEQLVERPNEWFVEIDIASWRVPRYAGPWSRNDKYDDAHHRWHTLPRELCENLVTVLNQELFPSPKALPK